MAERSVRKKNRILVLAMTAAAVLSMAGGLYAGSGREGEVYDQVKTFFTPADTDAVFYDEARKIDDKIRELENESSKRSGDIRRFIHEFVRKDKLIMRDNKS